MKIYTVRIQGQSRPFVTIDKDRAYDMRATAMNAKRHVIVSERRVA